MICCDRIQKIANSRLRQRHRHAMPADDRWCDNAISTGSDQLRLRLFGSGTGDNVNPRVQIARRQNDVNVVGIIWQTSSNPASVFNSRLDQTLLERCIANENRDAGIH